MKTSKIVVILIAFAIIVGGCDRIRSVLGMPTSADLETVREQEAAKAGMKRFEDSVKLAKADSLKVAQAAISADGYSNMSKRFYVIVGSFKVEENAAKKVEQMKKLNLNPEYLNFKNGFKVVSAMSTDDEKEAYAEMRKLIDEGIDEEEVWIYDKLQKLHIEK
jgi:hypothetical protein